MSPSARDVLPCKLSERLERERIQLLLIDDARRGLADIEAGRTCAADATIAQLQQRRAGAVSVSGAKF